MIGMVLVFFLVWGGCEGVDWADGLSCWVLLGRRRWCWEMGLVFIVFLVGQGWVIGRMEGDLRLLFVLRIF